MGSIPTRSRPPRSRADRPCSEASLPTSDLPRRACLIINPQASRGRGRGLARPLTEAASALGWETVVRSTVRAGQEPALAATACREGWPVVIAVGGDGTAHGVANGILQSGTDAVLGHVPIGTGNDFAKILGLRPGPVDRNLARVLGGTVRRLDVGRALGEYFVNGMGVGFDAEVVRHSLTMNHLSGFPLYLTAVYKTFWSFTAPELDVHAAEHAERGRLMMLEIAIGTTAGGGFRLTPDAQPDDGLFDVCLIREVGWVRFLRYVPRVIRGTHTRLEPVTMFRANRVRITGVGEPPPVHLDGELRLPRDATVDVELLPRRLAVLCAS